MLKKNEVEIEKYSKRYEEIERYNCELEKNNKILREEMGSVKTDKTALGEKVRNLEGEL